MLVFGTQIHIVTFIFIVMEAGMFIFQFFYYQFRPQDKSRLWYLLLLALLLFYNITGGLFPDDKITLISIPTQMMIAYGSGFLMASYFPFYFYKAFDLKALRWHALYGVPLFLACPYLIFFVVVYAINGNLNVDIKYGMIAPFIYALVLLFVMFRAIREKYKSNNYQNKYVEATAMCIAITPWAALAFFGLVESSQLIEVLCTNTGIIGITFLYIWKSIRYAREEYAGLQQLARLNDGMQIFEEMCRYHRLTNREIEIVLLIKQGLTYKQISEKLFIAGKTVENHIQNIYEKSKVKNKAGLIHKFFEGA